ncbi:hypothetical protein K2Z83_19085 [Oscillochloris sp. ZM17-4]|uniref:hypothetical protein n=1 Tax=Oscillochloris sp. ZM17-4 TaxID=2866714 RepID=UPI001C72A37C|nr:hypothetical protein [Oscillochloris sp. ZM17-4]MBX0329778.1 hypothetical protein [Oscillochloris sp. ZM17-4]
MAIFEVIEPVAGAPAPPGPWTTRPAPPASFSAGAAPAAGAPVWRARLPADPQAARAALDDAGRGLRAQGAALETAEGRMRRVAGGGASFAAGRTPAPELELMGLIGELRAAESGASSFGLRETASAGWGEAEAKFRAFAAQIHETLTSYAVVETEFGRALIGRTSVGWTGDVRSLLAAGLSPDQADLHRRTLALALESRAALLRTFTTVLRGATIVATMISSPVGAVTALPAAWKFVDQLLSDMRGS